MTSHAKLHRTAIRVALCIAALGGVPVAHAINKGQMSQFRYTPNGNSVSIKPNQNGSTGALAGTTDLRGRQGTEIGNGWYAGGNPPSGSATPGTMLMDHTGDVYFGGTKYPFQAGYQVPKGAVVEALGMLCKNPVVCLGLSLAAPSITAWLAKGDVSINPSESDYPDKPFILEKRGSGYEYSLSRAGWFPTPGQACQSRIAELNALFGESGRFTGSVRSDGNCWSSDRGKPADNIGMNKRESPVWVERYPASMDDIAPYMDPPEMPSSVVRDLLDRGADITLPGSPTVTGPTSLPGRTETTKNPDGSTTTTTTTNNFRTDGNRITNTSTVTTTQTCTGDGACSPTTTTTTEDPKEPEQSDCEKNPEATRCKDIELDTPDGEIPKAEKSVAYTPESLFGGGSCPANKVMTLHTGQQLTVWDWDGSCPYITGGMRPIVLVLCGFAAFAIVAGGTKP